MIKFLIYVFGSVRLKIEDICESVSSGKSKSRATEGKYPVYGSTGIIAKTETAMYFKDNILVARVGANAGYVHMAHGEYDVSDNTLIINVLDNYNQKYVFYLLENLNLHQYAKGGGQPLVTAGEIKKLEIRMPNQKEQQKVVEILDRFDALCNDLSEGLPAEIEARQKQYEYYRNKLLTFKEIEKVE